MKLTGDVIGIPLGTRLHGLIVHADHTDVWIAIKQRAQRHDKWQGTFLRVYHSGRVERITRDDAYTYDDVFVIKE